jgi:hypothetical protein
MNSTTTHPLRSAPGTLAGSAGPFLLVGLGTAACDFAAHLGVMRAETRIGHLADISLMHQIDINGGFKDRGGKFNLAQLFALDIKNIYFHDYLAPYPQWLLLASLFDYDHAAFATRHGTMNAQQIAFDVHEHYLESLHSHSIAAHVTRATGVLKNTARRCTRSTRARSAMAIRLTVGLFAAFEVMTLYSTSEPLTFACAYNIYMLTDREDVNGQLIPYIRSFFRTEFTQEAKR